jgi:hypothetical protein
MTELEKEPPPPPPAVRVTCRLGKVSSPNGVAIDASKAGPNSSRWVFDVEHDTHREPAFELDLLSFRTGRKREAVLLSPTCAPTDAAGAKAHVRFPEPDRLRIEADDVGLARYRITVDSSQGGV